MLFCADIEHHLQLDFELPRKDDLQFGLLSFIPKRLLLDHHRLHVQRSSHLLRTHFLSLLHELRNVIKLLDHPISDNNMAFDYKGVLKVGAIGAVGMLLYTQIKALIAAMTQSE